VGGAVEIEVERGFTRDGMGAHDRMRDVLQRFEGSFGGDTRRECAPVVVAVHGAQSDESLPLLPVEEPVRRAHVEELRRTSRPGRQFASVEHGRERGTLDVRIVGVERLEQAGALRVEPAERHISQFGSKLVGEHEAGVDDLTLLAVAELVPVAGPTDRILDRPDHFGNGARLAVVQRCREAHAHNCVLPQ
jgi:hypothetical protein